MGTKCWVPVTDIETQNMPQGLFFPFLYLEPKFSSLWRNYFELLWCNIGNFSSPHICFHVSFLYHAFSNITEYLNNSYIGYGNRCRNSKTVTGTFVLYPLYNIYLSNMWRDIAQLVWCCDGIKLNFSGPVTECRSIILRVVII